MSDVGSAVAVFLFAQLGSKVREHYSEESAEAQDAVVRELMGKHAVSVDSGGRLHFHDVELVKQLAPRLLPLDIKGKSEDARLRRTEEITARLQPLKTPRLDDWRAEVAKLGPLPPNATDAQKCGRAALLTKIYEAGGVQYGGDEDGSP